MSTYNANVFIIFLLMGFTSCEDLFEYHPNQIRLSSDEQDLTVKNLDKIKNQPTSDTLRLLIMGDTQRFYDATQDFVKKANEFQNIDFVVHLGDISDFGLAQEHKWVNSIMKNLKWPYLTVIGNHDMLANGRKIYNQMFGAFNYSLVYGHTKFVFLDTNGRESSFNGKVPDLNWLEKQLQQEPAATWKQAMVIAHIPPDDSDFDSKLEMPFHQILKDSQHVPVFFFGHIHNWYTGYKYQDQVLYHGTTAIKKPTILLRQNLGDR